MSSVMRVSPLRAALFDRLGGFDVVDRAVGRALARAIADPDLAGVLPAAASAEASWQCQMFLTELGGGPMAYDGPDPATVAARLALDPSRVEALLAHLLAAFESEGVLPAALAELREALWQEAARLGLVAAPDPTPPAAAGPTPEALVLMAQAEAERQGVGGWPLFVLDAGLTLVHLNAAAEQAVRAVDGELRRAFNLGADELLGQAILRIHPAPTQFSAMLTDPTRLPRETTWCFGRAVWKARPFALRQRAELVGYGIGWRDQSEAHRAEAVFQRLRSQAEDLPVPVMLPDGARQRWYGNAACDTALSRLAPHLAVPVAPGDGVPIELFIPDREWREALFRDPARLPWKGQVQVGPETVAILVSAVLDQEQHYLGPQVTWEIVHRTVEPARPAEPVVAAAAPVAPSGPAPEAVPSAVHAGLVPAGGGLREQARALEGVAQELGTLTRLLEAVADEADQVPVDGPPSGPAPDSAALQRADAAIREALAAVQSAAGEAVAGVVAEARALAEVVQPRLGGALQQAQAQTESLRRIRVLAAGLRSLGQPGAGEG